MCVLAVVRAGLGLAEEKKVVCCCGLEWTSVQSKPFSHVEVGLPSSRLPGDRKLLVAV